jgi:hypothetical protein
MAAAEIPAALVFTFGQTSANAARSNQPSPVGKRVMAEYRVYTIGHVDEQFIAVRSIECPDDHAAIRQARQMVVGHSLEVWELERFVIRLDDPG